MSNSADGLDFPPFAPRAPWYGPDLQSVAYEVLAKRIDRAKWPSREVVVDAGDGTGDSFVHHLHVPDAGGPPRPTVLLLHGLGGSADAGYLWLAALDLLDDGYPVLRCNKRGCGAGTDRSAGCAWHGDTAVFAATARHVAARAGELGLPGTDLAAIGFSLGGNTLVQWIDQEVRRAADDRPRLLAAATVSAPIDLVASTKRLDGVRNWPYRPYLLKKLRDHATRPAATRITDGQREAARACRCMWDFGADFNAPRLGFDDGQAYFGSASLVERLGRVDLPLLMIHSRDDPWVPHDQYDALDWSRYPNVRTLYSDRGGHMGFHGSGEVAAWDVHCATRFIEHHAARSSPTPA